MAACSSRVSSLDKTIKDVPKRLGERKEDTSAAASQPDSPLKETTDTGDDKHHSAPEDLTEVKGSQHIFII